LTLIGSYADTRAKYSYDGDWGNPVLWAPFLFQYNDIQYRHRTTQSLEARLAKTKDEGLSWLIGVYALQLHEGLAEDSEGLFYDPSEGGPIPPVSSTLTSSHYQSRNGAVFGEVDGDLTAAWRWSAGLRGERRTTRYADVVLNPDSAHYFRPADNLWGAEASLTRKLSQTANLYATVSRGYRASGFNTSEPLPDNQRVFGAESDLSFETGYKADLFEQRLRVNADVFYMRRKSPQIKTSEQTDPYDPNTFVLFTANAASGFNYGLESEVQWQASSTVGLGASLGLLQTRYHGFVQDGEVLPDRELPNAPNWQAAIDATYHDPRGPFARVDVTGMGGYYFDLPPNWTTSKPYGLVNGRLGWQTTRWSASVWGRNLLNKDYPVRGFYFADSPFDPTNHLYTQLGDPRSWGVDATYFF
jgi:outer membrane receptor protein involved in Fe transport